MKKLRLVTLIVLTCIMCIPLIGKEKIADIKGFSSETNLVIKEGKLWIFHSGGFNKKGLIFNSTDGKHWDLVSDKVNNIYSWSSGVVFKNKFYSIGGHPEETVVNDVFYSENGIDWDTYKAPFSGRKKMATVVHNNKLFVIGGAGLNDVWRSNDGLNWEKATDKLSTDFPHFWRPKAVSLGNRLIVFGGHKTDFGFNDNRRGIYISEDDGSNWSRYEMPFDVNLDECRGYFVLNNKLYIATLNAPNAEHGEGNVIPSTLKYFMSSDGVNWEELSNAHFDMLSSLEIESKCVVFNGKAVSINRAIEEGKAVYYYSEFAEPEIYIKNINSTVKTEDALTNIEFPLEYYNVSDKSKTNIVFTVNTSRPDIIACGDIQVLDDKIVITKASGLGLATITITASNGPSSNSAVFDVYVFPNSKVLIHGLKGYVIPVNTPMTDINFIMSKLSSYGTNTFTVTCDDPSIDVSGIDVGSNIVLPGFHYLSGHESISTAIAKEFKFTITASDGTNSFDFPIWVKIGENKSPEIKGDAVLPTVEYVKGAAFDYTLGDNVIVDEDQTQLYYSATGLPCGFYIDETTGNISGSSNAPLPYSIKIIGTDHYREKAEVILNVVENTSIASVNAVASLQEVCPSAEVQLDVEIGDLKNCTYVWTSTPAGFNSTEKSPKAVPTENTTYTVVVSSNGNDYTSSVDITLNDLPDITLNDTYESCKSNKLVLTTEPNSDYTYLWSNNEITNSIQVSYGSNNTDKYSVTVTSSKGCADFKETTITWIDCDLEASATPEEVCPSAEVQLDVEIGDLKNCTYVWTSTPAGFNSTEKSPKVAPSESTTYNVVVTSNGSTLSGIVTVNVHSVPTLDLGEDLSVCKQETIMLDTKLDNTYTHVWSTGATESSIDVSYNNIDSEIYSIDVTSDKGCKIDDEINITWIDCEVKVRASKEKVCSGDEVELSVEINGIDIDNAEFAWSSDKDNFNSDKSIVKVTVSETTTFVLKVKYNNVDYTDNITIVAEIIEIDLGKDIEECDDKKVILTAPDKDNVTYLWSNGSTEKSIEVSYNNKSSDTYKLTVTSSTSCSASDEIIINWKDCTDVDEVNGKIKVYPNPTNSNINLSMDDIIERIDVYSVDQVMIKSISPNKKNAIVNLSSNVKGMYILKIHSESDINVIKIIKR
ncbi:MAG: T9SS type A sorting domain-containing protein [Hyphomicrobiales bacterium]